MSYSITAYNTKGCEIDIPASKSISNRLLLITSLANECSTIHNLAQCDDVHVMQEALNSNSTHINIHHAGTAMRFLTAYLAQSSQSCTISGSARMSQRPIRELVKSLQSLGANIQYIRQEGYPPLYIEGKKLTGGSLKINANISSQYISALLLIAPYMEKGLQLTLEGEIVSQPYINMTIALMQQYGASVSWQNSTIKVKPGEYHSNKETTIESDWTAASYWYEIALLNGCKYRLKNLTPNSLQGDAQVAQYFDILGVKTSYDNTGVIIEYDPCSKPCTCFTANLSDTPDIAQTIAMSCALKGIPFQLEGLKNLRIKESDRIAALQIEAKKLGYHFTTPHEGVLSWNGKRLTTVTGPIRIATYDDHRMAMAFAPAAIYNHITIENPQVVTKSYPTYWQDLIKAHFEITKNSRKETTI